MKLTEITLESGYQINQHRIGRFSDGVNIIEGRSSSAKTAVRQFVRDTLLGLRHHRQTENRANNPAVSGFLAIQDGLEEVRLYRDRDHDTRLQSTSVSSSQILLNSIAQLLGQLNSEVYDTIYNFSLKQTNQGLARLARVLNQYFDVSFGVAGGDVGEVLQVRSRELQYRKARHHELREQVERLSLRRVELARDAEHNDRLRQSRLLELDREIHSITSQINGIDLEVPRNQLANLDLEIAGIREFIDQTELRESSGPPRASTSNLPDLLALFYLRLDEIDSQIRRWRRVQSEVQAQRVRLKDEMQLWNELTLESADHPYHQAKQHLGALEERIIQTDLQAKQWELAPVHHTDPSQTVRTIQTLCQSMRQDLQGLSNQLGTQYKSIRHRAAALELKQLRNLFNLINENVERLVRRRDQVIEEIRFVDAAGAEAIIRAEVSFMQCALHEGYLEARRRFVGPVPKLAEPTRPWSKTDLTGARARLQSLQTESHHLRRQIIEFEASLSEMKSRLANLVSERSRLTESVRSVLPNELTQLDAEINRLTAERDDVARLIDDADQGQLQPVQNTILTQAAMYLQQLSGGEWSRVWLTEGPTGGFVVANRSGLAKAVHVLPSSIQNFVYLSLAFAAQRARSGLGTRLPTVIEDVVTDLSRDQLAQLVYFLNGLQRDGWQLLLLTEFGYFGSVDNFARFVLPHQSEADFVPTFPITASDARKSGPAIPSSGNTFTSPGTLTSWVDSGDIDPITLYQDSHIGPTASRPRAAASANLTDGNDYIVSYSPSALSSVRAQRSELHSGWGTTAPVAVETFGDALGFAPAFDDTTELDRIDLLDPPRLRALSEVGIDTVGQLLQLSPENLPTGLRERGISGDQVDRWQAVAWLLSNTPGMRIQDAKILVACGVTEPEHLATSHPQQLLERIQRFSSSSEGQRMVQNSPGISLVRINGWMRALNTSRARWQCPSGFSRHARRRDQRSANMVRNPERQSIPRPNYREQQPIRSDHPGSDDSRPQREGRTRPNEPLPAYPIRGDLRPALEPRQPFVARPPRMLTPEPTSRPREFAPEQNRVEREPGPASQSKLKGNIGGSMSQRPGAEKGGSVPAIDNKIRFHLELKDHIEAAPSIGPKTAERFERIGVRSVEDFLSQTAESMAGKLKYQRITADLIRSWQHQTRLVCRIPNLRGHDAQLLVACNLIEPEKIAMLQPQRLLDIVLPFARSKEGLKIVRTGKEPDLQEVSDWIRWAGMTRSLHAA